MTDHLLVLNAGSSSIKFAVYDRAALLVLSGSAEGIGAQSKLGIDGQNITARFQDHASALDRILTALHDKGFPLSAFQAAAHRVVHGGQKLIAPARVTDAVAAEIRACIPLAPLHNPHNLAAIETLANRAPDLAQFASFDTAFHATNPEVAKRYAVPAEAEKIGIRRYGFHGLSYAALTRRLPELTHKPLPARLLAFHLGNGASVCAIENGQSTATTMGYSPISGLTMGTRTGDIDANAVLRLVETFGLEPTKSLLNNASGLKGLGGASDMRRLAAEDTPEARFAIDHFCHWAARQAGNLVMAMGGLDAIAFTGGIGEHSSQVRAAILKQFQWLGVEVDLAANERSNLQLSGDRSKIAIYRVTADEERQICLDALGLLAQKNRS